MPPTPSKETRRDEKKMDVLGMADDLVDLCVRLETLAARALAEDYQDDAARTLAIKGLDELRRGFYGQLTDRQDAQASFITQKLSQQEGLDRANDVTKQAERVTATEIKNLARRLRDAVREK